MDTSASQTNPEQNAMDCGPMAEPTAEHEWLQKFVGEWTVESKMSMGPGQPEMTGTGTESVRSLGGLWIIGEGAAEMPGGGEMQSIITIGYDPAKGKYVGTFIAGVMTHLWIYEGSLDADKRVLTLDCEGPNMMDPSGGLVRYQDIIEWVDDNHRILRSQAPGPDGNWIQFMEAHYRRKV